MTEGSDQDADGGPQGSARFRCPYCQAYDVARLYVATAKIDSCECCVCGARWDEDNRTGRYRGRSDRWSVLLPRDRRR